MLSEFTIDGKRYTLGDIVRSAFERSGDTPEYWNARTQMDRDVALVLEYHIIKNREKTK